MKWFLSLTATLVVAALGMAAWFFWPVLNPPAVATTTPTASVAMIERGAYLARIGNCIGCHTAADGPPYAGGRHVPTPFGTVFTSNLTPDAETGLGLWTAADFYRAMHHGQAKDGTFLLPAFPFTNYTRVTREDSDAIYVFLQSLAPVERVTPEADMAFPYNTQLARLGWQRLFFRPGTFEPEPERSDAWNRGRYLVEGLGHCSACHTIRGPLGEEREDYEYAGGRIAGMEWDALPLNVSERMDEVDRAELKQLLHAGTSRDNVTSGPMAEVVFNSTQYLTDADLDAMIAYISSLPVKPKPEPPASTRVNDKRRADLIKRGSAVYQTHCESCHGRDGEGRAYAYPALAGNPLVIAPSANNAIRMVLHGGFAPSTQANPRPYGMPPFSHQLDDEEVAAVISYVRNAWGNRASAVAPVAISDY
mgnify:FL=1